METSINPQENQNRSLISSPDSRSSNSSSSSASSNGPPPLPPPPPAAAAAAVLPVTRSEPNNPYPTTFVQANASSFKQVVQMLTGSSDPANPAAASARPDPSRNHIPPIKTGTKKEKSASRLYERRNSMKNFKINPLGPGFGFTASPRPGTPEILSPSVLDFPSLTLSPVTPLIPDPFNKSGNLNMEAEEKAIAKKGFYLHPSPANTPKDSEPRLLPLFPLTSPRISSDSSNSNS